MHQICMYPEHRRSDFPILSAREEKRAIYGAVIVDDKVLRRQLEVNEQSRMTQASC